MHRYDRTQELDAVHAGHALIADDDGNGTFLFQDLQALLAIGHGRDIEPSTQPSLE